MTDINIEKNIVARVHYTGTLPDTGEVFDSSEGRVIRLRFSLATVK